MAQRFILKIDSNGLVVKGGEIKSEWKIKTTKAIQSLDNFI